jgi:hypothetical protein
MAILNGLLEAAESLESLDDAQHVLRVVTAATAIGQGIAARNPQAISMAVANLEKELG